MSEVYFYKPEVQAPESIWIDRGPNGGWMFRTEKLHDSVRQYVPATRIAALEAELAAAREFVAEAVVMLDNANSPTDDARYDYVQRAVAHLINAAQQEPTP